MNISYNILATSINETGYILFYLRQSNVNLHLYIINTAEGKYGGGIVLSTRATTVILGNLDNVS